jgi:hypothetical protein
MEAQTFELKTPYLKTGRSHNILAQTDLINVAIKYYYEGGENSLHAHPSEDHAFIVLDGEATPEVFEIPGFRLALAIASWAGMTSELFKGFRKQDTSSLLKKARSVSLLCDIGFHSGLLPTAISSQSSSSSIT